MNKPPHNRAICSGDKPITPSLEKSVGLKMKGFSLSKLKWLSENATTRLWRNAAAEEIGNRMLADSTGARKGSHLTSKKRP